MKTQEQLFEEWNSSYKMPSLQSKNFVKDSLRDAFLARQPEIDELRREILALNMKVEGLGNRIEKFDL